MNFFAAFALCISVIISVPDGLLAAEASLAPVKKDTPVKKGIQSMASKIKKQADAGIGLVLQNIFLSQGGDGNELWRLQASYASVSTDNNTTSVEAPVVRYTLGDPALEDYIHVTAEKGHIKDNQQFLVLVGNVRVRRADQYIIGDVMEYDAKTRIMVFPDGAILGNPLGSGSTKMLSWRLDENILHAKGTVDMSFKKEFKPKQTPAMRNKTSQKTDVDLKNIQ